jgi:hypothetical protein
VDGSPFAAERVPHALIVNRSADFNRSQRRISGGWPRVRSRWIAPPQTGLLGHKGKRMHESVTVICDGESGFQREAPADQITSLGFRRVGSRRFSNSSDGKPPSA